MKWLEIYGWSNYNRTIAAGALIKTIRQQGEHSVGEIVIEESNYRAVSLALGSLFLFIASLAIYVYGITRNHVAYWLPGLFAGIIFFIGFAIFVSKAVKVRKLLTITTDGIIDNSRHGGFGFISYDDIGEFQIESLYRARVIAIIPKNLDSFILKLPLVKRRQVKRNLIMKLPPVSINVEQAKDMEPEDILSLLKKRLSDYSRLYE